jgi:hypothetical protein
MALRDPDLTIGPYRERDTVFLTAMVRDNLNVAIPGTSLDSAVYSLYLEKSPYTIINGRDKVNCVTSIDANGLLTMELSQADMAIVDGKLEEFHRLLFEWIWNTDKRGSYEIRVIVSNVVKVPV